LFFQSRASYVVNAVALLLPFALAAMAVGVSQIGSRRLHWHARVQTWLSTAMLALVVWLEWDVRTTGWWEAAKPSRFFPWGVCGVLALHLACAVASLVSWTAALWIGWSRVRSDGELGQYGSSHRRWGWRAVWTTVATAVTAEIFYLVAFVA
jgi:hypothetical protein